MSSVDTILRRLQVDASRYTRITEESFASEVYLVDARHRQLILKCAHSELKYWRELKSLEFLEGKIPVPKVIGAQRPEPGFNGAMLMDKLAGQPLNVSAINLPIARACGQMLAKLHLIPVPGLGYFQEDGFKEYPFEDWWVYRRDMIFGAWTKTIEDKIAPEVLKRIHATLKHYLDKFGRSTNCYIHCDYRLGNLLADDGGNLIGLIDFESARTGDPAYDFIKIYDSIESHPDLWESFLAGYAELRPLPDLEATIPYYKLDLNFGFLQWAVLRGDERLFGEKLKKLLALVESRQ